MNKFNEAETAYLKELAHWINTEKSFGLAEVRNIITHIKKSDDIFEKITSLNLMRMVFKDDSTKVLEFFEKVEAEIKKLKTTDNCYVILKG